MTFDPQKITSPTTVTTQDSFPTSCMESFIIEPKLKDPGDNLLSEAEEVAAVRKTDWIILPVVFMFSFLSHLDRSNLGNARVAGLQRELEMSDKQFSIALTVTFIPYVLSEIPATLLLKRIGPNILIPLLVAIWGFVTTLQGFVTSYSGLLAARFFLGAVEGGIYPASVLYLANFYKRDELQIRIALFSSSAAFSGAISGLLAFEIIKMDGLHGVPGWKWIFIIEGIFTTLFGLFSFLIFPKSPLTCRFLTPKDKFILTTRIQKQRLKGATEDDDRFDWYQIKAAYTSPHVILVALALFMTGANLYSLAYFQPSIIHSLGYSSSATQLISVPPFAVGFVAMIVTSYLSDHFRARGFTAISCAFVGFAGYLLFYINPTHSSRYASLFLSTAGIYSVSPTLYAWLANNSTPHYRKAAAVAIGPVAANTGGILSTWMFPTSEQPGYHTGISISLAFSAGIIILCSMNVFYLRFLNGQKRHSSISHPKGALALENSTSSWKILGDRHPDFEYAY